MCLYFLPVPSEGAVSLLLVELGWLGREPGEEEDWVPGTCSIQLSCRDGIRLGSRLVPHSHQAVSVSCCMKSSLLFLWVVESVEGKGGCTSLPLVIYSNSGVRSLSSAWWRPVVGVAWGETLGVEMLRC